MTDNLDTNSIPSPTPNPTSLLNNEPIPVEMMGQTNVLEAAIENEETTSAEDMLVVQIDDDAMVIILLCLLDDGDDKNDDYMAEEGLEIL
jgi:hypothetical protein